MSPVDTSPSVRGDGNFELLCALRANDIPVHKYKSRRTGMTVVIADVEGPVVNGYFCLATEAYDDDGLPHTLEHLIFLGSEQYPYKGILDLIANRCLASGTNAWTDTDHTCYTMTTAGSEGFLSLMPIYLEHVLYPTLTDSGYTTEVHHVTGEGQDGGVVYCEMQGRENTGESRSYLNMLRAIYPGQCGYKSETGGVMKNLRESTDNTKVRDYHKKFYRPENLTLIITGQVKTEDVFLALRPFEDKIVAKGDTGAFTRPWQNPVPPLEDSVDQLIPYPCDEEDNGLVYIGWRGPSAVKDLYRICACSVLLKYLTDTSVSPLQKEFVEIEDPFSSKVCYSLVENSESVLYLMFENVPVNKLDLVKPRLMDILGALLKKEIKLDMKRMRTVVHRQILETLSHLENNPHDSIAFMIIGDMLYGNTKEDLDHRLNQIKDLEQMEREGEDFWLNLMKKYLIDSPSITIRGMPSCEEEKKMSETEKARIEEQKKQLGEDGLRKKAKELQKATEENEKPPPKEILTSVPIPSISSINFHPVFRFTTNSEKTHPQFDISEVPVYFQLDDIHTNFVYLILLMDTSPVPHNLRPYLPLFIETLMESPVKRDGVVVPYEDIVSELEADTVHTNFGLGLDTDTRFTCGPFCQTASLLLQVEPTKYERGIQWIKELLYQTVFAPERLKIIAAKMANDVSQLKRQGNRVVGGLMKGLRFNKESNHYASDMMRQHKFLTSVIEKLEQKSTKQSEVIADLESIREILTSPKNIAIHMAANVKNVTQIVDPVVPWKNFLPEDKPAVKNKIAVVPDWTFLLQSPDEKIQNCVLGLGCVESAFLAHTAPCLKDYNHPDLPALLVFLQYLSQLEGPMWRQIRGLGLSYSYSIRPRPNEGLLYLTLYRSTNVVSAFKEAKSIIECYLSQKEEWEPSLLESARSSLIFEIIEREKSVGDVVGQSLLSYFKGVDHDYNRNLVKRIAEVTKEDLNRVGRVYIASLFKPENSKTAIVCHPSKVGEVTVGFKEFGCELSVLPSLEESCLSQLEKLVI